MQIERRPSELVRLYGPLASFVLVLMLVVVLVPATRAGRSGTSGQSVSAEGGPGGTGEVGGTGAEQAAAASEEAARLAAGAGAAGGASRAAGSGVPAGAASGKACRKEDGRQPGISRYMPPCVDVFGGDNGGATAKGVFRDKIVVARYVNWGDPATRAAANALNNNLVASKEAYDSESAALFRYFNAHYETYGREVVPVTVEASGTDEKAARADAIKIANELGAFAAYPGTGGADTPAFAQELAARGVFCMGCGLEPPRAFLRQTKGYVFSTAPSVDEIYENLAEYIGKRLARRPAKHAGQPDLQAQQRKFGLIWLHNSYPSGGPPDPGMREARDVFASQLARYGVPLTKDVGYLFDVQRLQEQATNIIVAMKTAGVTSVGLFADLASAAVFTKEATRQAYFPEWVLAGGIATDTTLAGRLMDPLQWRHAFGVSPLWLNPTNFETFAGYREYKHMVPGGDRADGNRTTIIVHQTVELLFTGVHMAGPRLTPDSYRNGMYAYPHSGGVSTAPLHYFTPDNPMAIKDYAEVYWDPDATGPDEVGTNTSGVLMKSDGGRRYSLGLWPSSDASVFNGSGLGSADDPTVGLPHEQDGHRHPPVRCRSCR